MEIQSRVMSIVGSKSLVADEDTLVRLLQMGVAIEEYAEEKSAFMLGFSVSDDDTRDILFDSLDESQTHRDMLVDLIESLDQGDVDSEHIEEIVKSVIEKKVATPDNREDALREQLKSESLARDFYDSLIEALRNSRAHLDVENMDDVLETLMDIRDDEAEDAEKLMNVLGEINE